MKTERHRCINKPLPRIVKRNTNGDVENESENQADRNVFYLNINTTCGIGDFFLHNLCKFHANDGTAECNTACRKNCRYNKPKFRLCEKICSSN